MAGYRDATAHLSERARELRESIAATEVETRALEAERRALLQEWRSVRAIVRPGGWLLALLWTALFITLTFLWEVLDAPRKLPPAARPARVESPLAVAPRAQPRRQFSAAGWHLEQMVGSGSPCPAASRIQDRPVLAGQRIEAAWEDGRKHVWLAGGGHVFRLPASSLWVGGLLVHEAELALVAEDTHWSCLWPTKRPCSGLVRAIWGAGPDEVWIAGNDGILHWSNGRWGPSEPRGAFALWGTSARDVWAVGRRGSIRHWNGRMWLEHPAVSPSDLYGISGTGPDDVWAVGDDWTVLRWDGSAWSSVTTPADMLAEASTGPLPDRRVLNSVCAGPDVWIASESGAVLHFDPSETP